MRKQEDKNIRLIFALLAIIVVILLITVGIISKRPPVWGSPEINENSRYLISSIFQGLVAAFAMIFTFILVAIQLSYNYSELLIDKFFNLLDIAYLMLFLTNAILSLLILEGIFLTPISLGGFTVDMQKAIYIDVILSIGLLSALLPYVMYVERRMNVLYLANTLRKECLKTVTKYLAKSNKSLNKEQVLKELKEKSMGPLFSIVFRLAADKKYYLIPRVLEMMEHLIEEIIELAIYQKENKMFLELIEIVVEISWSMNNIGENFIEDRFVIDETISSLVRINKKFISTILIDDKISSSWREFLLYGKLENINYDNTPIMKTTQMLEDIAWRASYKNLDYVINVVFSGIEELREFVNSTEVKEERKKYKEEIIALINGWHIIMGAYAKYSKDEYMLNQSLKILSNSCPCADISKAEEAKKCINNAKNWANKIIRAHPRWVLNVETLNNFVQSVEEICFSKRSSK